MTGFKLFAWTTGAVGLGLFLGAFEIGRKTPLEHARSAWKAQVSAPALDTMKRRIGEAVEDVQDEIASDEEKPRERHTPQDRAVVDRIIANGKSGSGRRSK